MTQVPPPLLDFARRLFAHEAAGSERTEDLVNAMERARRALDTQLTPLVSAAGFTALFSRAVKLAAREFPFLATTIAVGTPDDSINGLRHAAQSHRPAEVADAFVAVLANFLWLLVIFIGENLGLRKVREVWPDVPPTPPGSSSQKVRT